DLRGRTTRRPEHPAGRRAEHDPDGPAPRIQPSLRSSRGEGCGPNGQNLSTARGTGVEPGAIAQLLEPNKLESGDRVEMPRRAGGVSPPSEPAGLRARQVL